MGTETEQLHFYLSALESAAHAISQARKIKPDPGLDHALERLRRLLVEGGCELQHAEDGDHHVA